MPRGPRPKDKTIEEIIVEQTKKEGEHTLWTGCTDSSGYGKIWFNKKRQGIHRVVWEMNKGPIPQGMMILHSCDIRNCIEPTHLFLGTSKDNVQDMLNKGRFNNQGTILTEQEIRIIRKSTESTYALAKQFKTAESTIRRIRNRITHNNVPD